MCISYRTRYDCWGEIRSPQYLPNMGWGVHVSSKKDDVTSVIDDNLTVNGHTEANYSGHLKS